MRALVLGAIFLAILVPGAASADTGPIKHWGTFPGREVRAISFRDNFGDAYYAVVQGRDGHVYMRGRWELYRLLDDAGHFEVVMQTGDCSGPYEAQGVDLRTRVPMAVCDRGAEIIVFVTQGYHRHFRVPLPEWVGTAEPTRGDRRYLTSVVSAGDGGYWFAYGEVGGIGRVFPSGRATLLHLKGFGAIESLAAVGNDAYAIDERCRVLHLHGTVIAARYGAACGSGQSVFDMSVVATADGAVWALGGRSGVIVRYGPDGSRRRWDLKMSADGVVVSRDGTAYVLGASWTVNDGHLIAAIRPHGMPDVRVLPMSDTGTIAVDGRDRIWITAPFEHGAALIAPKGTWR